MLTPNDVATGYVTIADRIVFVQLDNFPAGVAQYREDILSWQAMHLHLWLAGGVRACRCGGGWLAQ
jgi:hypothetical protein